MTAATLTAQGSAVSSWGTFHVAYVLVAAIYISYTLSLWVRGRRYRRAIDSANASSRG
ncbi:MAG TPA: hypothetical protein VGH04_06995 [Gemmatimonadaceae bacterium]|jgi:hypothetical protein